MCTDELNTFRAFTQAGLPLTEIWKMRVESGNGSSSADALPLLQLPDTAFEHVLHFLSYELVAKLRRVSRRFNVAGKRVLNKGFRSAEKYHLKCLKVRGTKKAQDFSVNVAGCESPVAKEGI